MAPEAFACVKAQTAHLLFPVPGELVFQTELASWASDPCCPTQPLSPSESPKLGLMLAVIVLKLIIFE